MFQNSLGLANFGLGETPEATIEMLMDKWGPYKLTKTEDELRRVVRLFEEAGNYMIYDPEFKSMHSGTVEAIAFPFIGRLFQLIDPEPYTGADVINQLTHAWKKIRSAASDWDDVELVDLLIAQFSKDMRPRKRKLKIALSLVSPEDNPTKQQASALIKQAFAIAEATGMSVTGTAWSWE